MKEGIADISLAIHAVSRSFSLDFIPLIEEEYDLLVDEGIQRRPEVRAPFGSVASPEFASRLSELGGYNTKESGKIKYVNG